VATRRGAWVTRRGGVGGVDVHVVYLIVNKRYCSFLKRRNKDLPSVFHASFVVASSS
jgi:hypothetical protein